MDSQHNVEKEDLVNKINARINKLDTLLDSASYSKQKCKLKIEMEFFFLWLDFGKNLS